MHPGGDQIRYDSIERHSRKVHQKYVCFIFRMETISDFHRIVTRIVITEVPEKESNTSDTEVMLRRTQSFENDEK